MHFPPSVSLPVSPVPSVFLSHVSLVDAKISRCFSRKLIKNVFLRGEGDDEGKCRSCEKVISPLFPKHVALGRHLSSHLR